MLFAILATGQSLTQQQVDYVQGKCKVIAVSDAYKLAPWADYLVSHDTAWWRNNPDALNFAGRKFCYHLVGGTEQKRPEDAPTACNSGYLAMLIARDLGATKIILLGFDMHGTHYFGKHPAPLKNTNEKRFAAHIKQFDRWRLFKHKPEVINCTPGSSLHHFPNIGLADAI